MESHYTSKKIYRIGTVLIDGRKREVRKDGVLLTITPTGFGVLMQLVEQRDRVVSKNEFLRWHLESHHERHPLDNYIVKLRALFGDSDIRIDTVWGKGYQLAALAPVEQIRIYGSGAP